MTETELLQVLSEIRYELHQINENLKEIDKSLGYGLGVMGPIAIEIQSVGQSIIDK